MSDVLNDFLARIAGARDELTLEAIRVEALGKRGIVTALLKLLGTMSVEERKQRGPEINGFRDTVQHALSERRATLAEASLTARLAKDILDISLSTRSGTESRGRIHPVSQVVDEITAIFADMGFSIAEGPEIEADFYNFFEVENLRMRFRPSFFPFTEPSLEADIQCSTEGDELRIGQGTKWMEIPGCRMVHSNVLRNCGLDPDVYQGFAWGMGIDRIAMLKYGMPDLRAFFDADVRWLDHYGFRPLDIPTLFGGL